QSVFRVDPAKVPTGGVRARCSVCGAVIHVGHEQMQTAGVGGAGESWENTERALMESDAEAAPMSFEPSARRTPRSVTPAKPTTPAWTSRPATPARSAAAPAPPPMRAATPPVAAPTPPPVRAATPPPVASPAPGRPATPPPDAPPRE